MKAIPKAALSGSLKDYRVSKNSGLMSRADSFFSWQDLRRQHDLWPYARSTSSAPQPRSEIRSDAGKASSGVNFASQDYLSLASHPRIKAAAMEAIDKYGVHSAGSAALLGNTAYSLQLSAAFSEFLGGREVVLYPTGWAAGYGAIQGFVRSDDHVVMDILAHSCLQAGAAAATQKVHYFRHLDVEAAARRLANIRSADTKNDILVVTESVFSMHSDTPDLRALRSVCDTYGASLLVDCAHDFGCMGEDGLGHIGQQEMLDEIDIIIGSFSKTFASNGGFVAVKTRAAAEYLRYYSAPHTFSNALSPVQAATVLEALSIIRAGEGKELRHKLRDNVTHLRESMARSGREVLGEPSPIVPVRVGGEALGRLASKYLSIFAGLANLVEFPAVPLGQSRFRFQVMAGHSAEDVDTMVAAFNGAMDSASAELGQIQAGAGARETAVSEAD
ncbi:aminotransferase class I/II-fold pyridoxal phosphate-dependent enzyme [Pseudaminobacter soli (ex Li et al. 2025)]|uniref:8-amino-7-oxononanoate synthase n=1 Tax=Pseudaminobacter soli (ex Li et al. 2025) TaxID=1295366 RepID=A0A2P7S0T8_9HYPH|nr:pyridoxal phosphate-dependent aminotransferase family protein [Mesorhizobium soli]PSJ56087.1 8-amino-7-oxononanoate synthase [Mesorhizobium soli]